MQNIIPLTTKLNIDLKKEQYINDFSKQINKLIDTCKVQKIPQSVIIYFYKLMLQENL